MKKINLLLLLVVLLTVSSCSSARQLRKDVYVDRCYAETTNVVVYETGQTLPDNISRIGSITVGEAGWTRTSECTYEACLKALEVEAKKAGADVLYIVKITEPNAWTTTCYTITANIYKYIN